jgi:predicted esterase
VLPGQWFSVQGVTEENRQQRIDAIMPTFIETVRYWQKQTSYQFAPSKPDYRQRHETAAATVAQVLPGSEQGVTEENRQQRIDAIMPTFIETVRYWQKQSGLGRRKPATNLPHRNRIIANAMKQQQQLLRRCCRALNFRCKA